MRIALLEPYLTGSHLQWAEGLKKNSKHEFDIYALSGHHWKWRMHGGAVTLAEEFLRSEETYDLILATDMLDLTTFLSLTRKKTANTPVYLYFHENQLTYPWSPDDQDVQLERDNHYAFINHASALSADHVFFNSEYHRNSFLGALPEFLDSFPDHRDPERVAEIAAKSEVLHLGCSLRRFNEFKHEEKEQHPLILWNHRWEYDKNPEGFFDLLRRLKEQGFKFTLAVLGQDYKRKPEAFAQGEKDFADEIVHWGYVEDFAEYAYWLWKADILPVTSNQDFFGVSVVEATYCQTLPLVPDRLVYSEYIQAGNVYSSVEGLMLMMRAWQSLTIPDVSRFDWDNMIAQYDEKLSLLSVV